MTRVTSSRSQSISVQFTPYVRHRRCGCCARRGIHDKGLSLSSCACVSRTHAWLSSRIYDPEHVTITRIVQTLRMSRDWFDEWTVSWYALGGCVSFSWFCHSLFMYQRTFQKIRKYLIYKIYRSYRRITRSLTLHCFDIMLTYSLIDLEKYNKSILLFKNYFLFIICILYVYIFYMFYIFSSTLEVYNKSILKQIRKVV